MRTAVATIMSGVVVAIGVAAGFHTASAQSTVETTGPYVVQMLEEPSLPNHTVYRPAALSRVKGKLPLVAFANGGCANAGNAFREYLSEFASHGFLVVANGPVDTKSELAPGRPPAPGATNRGPGAVDAELAQRRAAAMERMANDPSLAPAGCQILTACAVAPNREAAVSRLRIASPGRIRCCRRQLGGGETCGPCVRSNRVRVPYRSEWLCAAL